MRENVCMCVCVCLCLCLCLCLCRGRMNCSMSIWIKNPGTFISRSFTTRPGADIMSPGLVQDGSRCGDGMVRYLSLLP